MKTAISLPDPLFQEAEAAAKDLGVSRSKLYQRALEEFLQRRRDAAVTESLNRALADEPDEVDPFVQALAFETLKRVKWEE